MDPLVTGIIIHKSIQQRAQHDTKEKPHMDPYMLYEYTKIRHDERLEQAASWKRGEAAPSLLWRIFALAGRTLKTLLAVRVTLTVHTADASRRTLTEPDMCID
jgi:hypothetical protein